MREDEMGKEGSRISGFYKLELDERLKILEERTNLSSEDIEELMNHGSLDMDTADMMIENVIGTYELPLAVATNFEVDGKDYFVPMSIEETSVVAAASYAARLARETGGFKTEVTEPVMIAQIQAVDIEDPFRAKQEILENKDKLVGIANEQNPDLSKFGGGAEDINVRVIDTGKGPMVITHLLVDCRDAMGANSVNSMAETLAPIIEDITNGEVYLRILSNLAKKRMARARMEIDKDLIGEDTVEGILYAYEFAEADPFRAATHNKGIMNGIDAVAKATGQDWRAIEAGAHAYASLNGYDSLTKWSKNEEGNLVGTLEMPLAVAKVGGITNMHPTVQKAFKILDVDTAKEFSRVVASVGLAQNFAALKALATTGIQEGHMKLHAKNIAVLAGADEDQIDEVAEKMVEREDVSQDQAEKILEEMKN